MEKEKQTTPAASGRVETDLDVVERLGSIDSKKQEEELAKLAAARDLASSEEMIGYADQKKKLVLPSLGYHVYYCPLRIEDRLKISEITDTNLEIQRDLRNREKVYLILSRADPEFWIKEKVYGLAAIFVDAILYEYDAVEDTRFLLPIIRRRSIGLRQTLQSKS